MDIEVVGENRDSDTQMDIILYKYRSISIYPSSVSQSVFVLVLACV
jgi:hypothetical protein